MISSVSNTYNRAYYAPSNRANAQKTQYSAYQNIASGETPKNGSVEQQFLDYMKKTPAQRMNDAWLKAHNLTEQDLAAMPPEKRDAIMKQMAADIKNETERKTEAKQYTKIDILV